MSSRPYDQYEESGVDWLGEVPSHWDVLPIKHILSTPITDGPHETPEFLDEGIPFVSAEAVSSGEIDFAKIRGFISQADHDRYCQKYKPEVGDVYMVKSGASTGTTAIVEDDREFSIWSPLAAIRCDEGSYPRFVLNFLRSRNFQEGVTLNWSFGTQQNIGMNVIENLHITRPPLDEQRAISSFLDVETSKIDSLVSEQRRLIELLKEKRQAVISHAVTKGLNPNVKMKPSGIQWLGDVPQHWGVSQFRRAISFLTDFEANCSFADMSKNTTFDEGEPFAWLVRATDLENNRHGICEETRFCDKATYEFLRKTSLYGGEFLVTKRGEIGKIYVVPHTKQPATLGPNLYLVQLHRNLQSEFAYYWFKGSFGNSQLEIRNQSTTIGALYKDDLRDCICTIPPPEEQTAIVRYLNESVESLERLITDAERAIELLQERRTALISAAVTGKIDVRGYKPEEAVA